MPAITMEDDLGIVYLVDNAQQFWSELEDILVITKEAIPTLEQLDLTLKRSLSLCAAYHEQYLQSPFQLEHACNMLLDTELFVFHSERMCDIVTSEAQSNTNPHFQFICFHVLLSFGRRRSDFFRSHKRWQPLLPVLMDHILVEIDSDVEDTYFGLSAGVGSGSGYSGANVPVPIEAKLRSLGVRLLYEMCRVQKLSIQDLRIFDDSFLDYLFDLVEQTRHMQDDTFNYSVIKLIVALNEQFMVASLGDEAGTNGNGANRHHQSSPENKNRVMRVLMRRLGSSQAFGENMIFMLNRAQRTPEDLCMQLLVLKLLYLIFTTKGTEEYFYTNDLCVLVDVFLRELADLDDDSDSLRHTYLRVLHPLLTKTQLRTIPYKRPQILYMLESLIRTSNVRDVNPITMRLVQRCLGGEWCVGLVRQKQHSNYNNPGTGVPDEMPALPSPRSPFYFESARRGSNASNASFSSANSGNSLHVVASTAAPSEPPRSRLHPPPPPPINIVSPPPSSTTTSSQPPLSSSHSGPIPRQPRRQGTANSAHVEGAFADPNSTHHHHNHHSQHGGSKPKSSSDIAISPSQPQEQKERRSAPPPPIQTKRRKPPAIPVGRSPAGSVSPGGSGVTFTAIKSSGVSSPLGR
ncbi:hypothetical protein EV359DRAFT_46971 [Lentinula novae-zelandiae]|nr:hypothetical protein EV359DRAFT_46971 [Lentinula novae-zelandiae]